MKDKRCKGYCGVTCVNGNCPIALYHEDFTMFERKPSCEDCFYYKGCEDCCFKDTDMCEKGGERMEVLFIPDLFKYEEEFIIEAANIEEVISKLQEEFPYNCLLNAYIISQHGLIYLGVVKLEEDKSPEWIEPDLDFSESEGAE